MNGHKAINNFIEHVLCTWRSLKLHIPRNQSQKDIFKTAQHFKVLSKLIKENEY